MRTVVTILEKKFRSKVQSEIHSAEQFRLEAPDRFLKMMTEEDWHEHAGYIKGLKTSLEILDRMDESELVDEE